MMQPLKTFFAPELHIPNGTINIDFYLNFGAKEHFCVRNDDGSIHVVELELDGAIFHLHETMRDALEPKSANGVTSVIGLFVEDVHDVFNRGISCSKPTFVSILYKRTTNNAICRPAEMN